MEPQRTEIVKIWAKILEGDGEEGRDLGRIELPHVPQIGSYILAVPPSEGGEEVQSNEQHVYEVVRVLYDVGRPSESGVRSLDGIEIIVRDRGGHLHSSYLGG